jgi:hypothetical protein
MSPPLATGIRGQFRCWGRRGRIKAAATARSDPKIASSDQRTVPMLSHVLLSREIWLRSPIQGEFTVRSVGQALFLMRNELSRHRRAQRHWIAADFALTGALTTATSGQVEAATAAVEAALRVEGWPHHSLPACRPRVVKRRPTMRRSQVSCSQHLQPKPAP